MPSLSSFYWIVLSWILLAVLIFIALQFITAPYGRHTRAWGPMIPNRLAWMIMELPGPIVMSLLYAFSPQELGTWHYFFLCLYLAHYINRSLIFPWRTRTQGKKMPLLIMLSAIFFNLCNGFILGFGLAWTDLDFPEGYAGNPAFLIAALLFVLGAYWNLQSDNILLSLRKGNETGYKIPYGGLFRYISCPNHFGEMLEWTGFALMVGNLAAWSFAIWTVANLLPRALDHHQWYRKHFTDYPSERKAVIPHVL